MLQGSISEFGIYIVRHLAEGTPVNTQFMNVSYLPHMQSEDDFIFLVTVNC